MIHYQKNKKEAERREERAFKQWAGSWWIGLMESPSECHFCAGDSGNETMHEVDIRMKSSPAHPG